MQSEEDEEGEEVIYVTVSDRVKESKANLIWALQTSGRKIICILHVHQPSSRIPTPMGRMLPDGVRPDLVKTHREKERKEMSQVLEEYVQLCQKSGVRIEKLYIESNCIEEGIIQLINQHGIRKLVMGAAADKHHTRTLTELRSKRAICVRDNAPLSCQIWFVCKGFLIYTRAAVRSANPNDAENGGVNPTAPPFDTRNWSPPRLSADTNYSPSVSRSVSERELTLPWSGPLSLPSPDHWNAVSHSPSERSMNEFLHDQAEISNVEPKLAKIQTFQGTVLESTYIEECRRRKEAEGELARVKEELEYMKNHVLGELRSAVEQKSLLENQISNCNVLLKMLGEKLASTINMVHHYVEQ